MSPFAKFCMFALVAIAVVAGALWFVGGKKQAYSTEFTLNATPQEVFVFLSKPKYLKQWVSGLQEMDLIEPSEGGKPQYEIVVFDRGRKLKLRQEVTRYVQDSMIVLQIRNPSMVSTSIFQLEKIGEKTKVSYKVREEGKGFSRIARPLQKNTTEERIREESRELKRVVEKNLDKLGEDLPDSPFSTPEPDEESNPVSAPEPISRFGPDKKRSLAVKVRL